MKRAIPLLLLAACKRDPEPATDADPEPVMEPAVTYDCGFVSIPSSTCPSSPAWIGQLDRLGAAFIAERGTAPTRDECRLASTALDRLLAVDPATLTTVERIVAQNGALRIVGPRTCGPEFPELSAKAARAVGHAALPAEALAALGDAPLPDLVDWLGPTRTWRDRRTETAPLFHDTMEFFTRAFRPVRGEKALAVFSQLVAVDTDWRVHVTPVVGRIELRAKAEREAAACIGKLDPGRLRCETGRIRPVPEEALPTNVFVRLTAPGRVDCNRCHGSDETHANLSDLTDPKAHLRERRRRFLAEAQQSVDSVRRKATER